MILQLSYHTVDLSDSVSFCFVDFVETCRMAKLVQHIEGLHGHEVSVDKSDYVSVSITT